MPAVAKKPNPTTAVDQRSEMRTRLREEMERDLVEKESALQAKAREIDKVKAEIDALPANVLGRRLAKLSAEWQSTDLLFDRAGAAAEKKLIENLTPAERDAITQFRTWLVVEQDRISIQAAVAAPDRDRCLSAIENAKRYNDPNGLAVAKGFFDSADRTFRRCKLRMAAILEAQRLWQDVHRAVNPFEAIAVIRRGVTEVDNAEIEDAK